MTGILYILQTLFLISPVVLAGIAHVVVLKRNYLAGLAFPLDFKTNIFGNNKTWRGVVVMASGSALAMSAQAWLYNESATIRDLAFFDYGAINPWVAGAIFGLGYSLGEIPNSFIKRRLGINPGKKPESLAGRKFSYFIDQADSVVGSLITMRYFFPASLTIVFTCFIIGVIIHAIVDKVLYMTKIKS